MTEAPNQTHPDPGPGSRFGGDNAALAVIAGILALGLGYLGLGLPQHYYQPLFAAIILALGWRHGIINVPESGWRWPLVIVMFLVLTLMFKLLIGGGTSYPFSWLKVPVFAMVEPAEEASWFAKAVPQFELNFRGIPNLSDWTIDITRIQTLFLVATLVGAMVGWAFGFNLIESLIIGAALTFSSTIIGLKLLPTTVLHHKRTGEIIISILLIQDIIAIVILLLLQTAGQTAGQSSLP